VVVLCIAEYSELIHDNAGFYAEEDKDDDTDMLLLHEQGMPHIETLQM